MTPSSPTMRRGEGLGIFLRLLTLMWAVGLAGASAVLLGTADFWSSRWFALWGICLGLLPLAVCWISGPGRRVAVLCVAALALSLPVVWLKLAPPGGSGNRVGHEFEPEGEGFRRYTLANFVAEGDQLRLAFRTATLLDPLFDLAQYDQLNELTRSLYQELESDPEFQRLGTVMGESYADVFGWGDRSRHVYLYVPPQVDRRAPAPILVFFHGSGGNFKAYLWILSKIADRVGCVVVAPSGGFGAWRGGDSEQGFERALRVASRHVVVDPARVYVAGLSNGGRAVSQVGAKFGARIRSLLFLSPVFDESATQSVAFAQAWRDRSVEILTGGQDDRIPFEYVRQCADRMVRTGAMVRLESITEANHFLIFSHREQLEKTMERWLRDEPGVRPLPARD